MSGAGSFWSSCSKAALNLLYPPKCGLCGLLGDEAICSVCAGSFQAKDLVLNSDHGLEFVDHIAALYAYEGRASQAVLRLKYSRITSLAEPMARLIAEYAKDLNLLDFDAFVPVPIHWTRRCFRGFNQSELLCEALPLDRVRTDLLRRTRATRSQTGLKPEERKRNLLGAFAGSPNAKGMLIALVDDVLTTGYTAQECARALKEAGASEVVAIAFAGGQ